MTVRKFVAYYRVSTAQQGRSGLGLEAQRKAVMDYLNGGRWELVAEFTEVESGKVIARPQLDQALATCELTGATLVVAKLDRLSRNLTFLSALMDSDAKFVAVDLPEMNEVTVQIMAVMAQAERKAISARTKAALAAAKARGAKLGGNRGGDLSKGSAAAAAARTAASRARHQKVRQAIDALRATGATSLRQIAAELDRQGVITPRGGQWSANQVRRVVGS